MTTKSRKKEVYKYALEDYNETYKSTLGILKILGIRFMRNDSKCVARCWTIFYWLEFCSMVIGAGAFLKVVSMVLTAGGGSFDDAVPIFMMMPCLGCVTLATTKTGKLMCNRPVFENLVRELRELWPQEELTEEDYVILKKGLVHLNRTVKGYYWCNWILIVIFIVPSYWIAVKKELGYDVTLILPLLVWFPFDPFQRYLYPFLLVFQTWAVTITVLAMISGDLLFVIFLSHTSTQFDLLSARVRRSIFVPVDRQLIKEYPLGEYSEYFKKNRMEVLQNMRDDDWEKQNQMELTKIILRHRTLLRLAGDVETMFSFALLINFFVSSIMICFCGFCCVVVEKWNEFVYKVFLLAALSQTWLLCWHGQRLMDSCEDMATALYECGWYTSGTKISKSIFIMLHSWLSLCDPGPGSSDLNQAYSRLTNMNKSFLGQSIKFYNKIPEDVTSLTEKKFKTHIKKCLCSKGYYKIRDYVNDKDVWTGIDTPAPNYL